MAEYQPLSLPETVRVKLDHWFYPADDQAGILKNYWDLILFQLVQDIGCSRGDKNCPSAWMKHKGITYEVRKGGFVAAEIYTLTRVKNGIAYDVPSSKTKLRWLLLSALSSKFDG